VLALGDSFTDDLQSWFEILRHLFERRRASDAVRFVNAGISGYTTAMALRRLVPTIASQPHWIICLLGGNDVTRVAPDPNKPSVSLDETGRNLAAIRRIAATHTAARWVWITPPTFDEARVASFEPFKYGQSDWRNADVVAVGDFIRSQPDVVVDIQSVFGVPADPHLQGPDGVHPALSGQQAIARVLVERLTA